ncbi:MAG: hypothetical protein AABX86_00065 [Nanoarchaeota archaeon]
MAEKDLPQLHREIDQLLHRGYASGNEFFHAWRKYCEELQTPKEKEHALQYFDERSGRKGIGSPLEEKISYQSPPSEDKDRKGAFLPAKYSLKIQWPVPQHPEPSDEIADVHVCFSNGDEYYALFMTPRCLLWLFAKNTRTGECLSGTYFNTSDNPVFVKTMEETDIRKTIDDIIRNDEFKDHFKALKKVEEKDLD